MSDSEQSGLFSDSGEQRRRAYLRLKLSVPVEVQTEASETPIRGATADLAMGGCYVETMFPFPVGTKLDLKLQLEGTLLIEALVVTSDPQVGNGIEFTKMLPEDREELKAYLEAATEAQKEKS
jgi:c-di-GMP-binding flagellar brake protein YcgR